MESNTSSDDDDDYYPPLMNNISSNIIADNDNYVHELFKHLHTNNNDDHHK